MMKHYRDQAGNYQGQINGNIPAGMIECPAPDHGLQDWNGAAWVDGPNTIADRKRAEVAELRGAISPALEALFNILAAKGLVIDADLPVDVVEKLTKLRDAP